MSIKLIGILIMKDFTTYLSTAPVVATAWFTFTAGLLIEINRFFPDPLAFSF
jgi:photosystem I subunit 9